MTGDDDIDFDAFMKERGVERLGAKGRARAKERAERAFAPDPGHREHRPGAARAGSTAPPHTASDPRGRSRLPTSDDHRLALARASTERDEARAALAAAHAALDTARDEHGALRDTLAQVRAERDEARAAITEAQSQCRTLTKERSALQQRLATPPAAPPAPAEPSLRQALAERGATDESEAIDLVLALLGHAPGELLDGLRGHSELTEALHNRLAMVCERPECQPREPIALVRVPPERCDVCRGSDIRVAWEILLRASRLAGVTRLVIVGGSPPYHAQLRDLCRGTDLKLDLVSGRSKPGRKRARNDVERVVIWGATILDHGTSAAYERLGDRLIRVTHRGISGMLREVARALRGTTQDQEGS